MKLKNPKIVFRNRFPCKPGDLLQGTASWTLERDIKVKSIKLMFCGCCKTKWKVGSGDDEKTYKGRQVYYYHTIMLYGDENGHDHSLAAGPYNSTFQYQLPSTLPSTFSAPYGSVTYFVSLDAEYSGVFSSDDSFVVDFVLMNPVVHNDPQRPIRMAQEGEDYSCCSMTKSALKLDVKTDKCMYNPGDYIVLNGYVMNGSSESVKKVKLVLTQVLTFYGFRSDLSLTSSGNLKCKQKKYQVAEWKGEDIAARTTTNIVDRQTLRIPDIPESFLKNCQIIDVDYFVTMEVELPGLCGFGISSQPLEITIGNAVSRNPAATESQVTPSAPPDPHINLEPSMVRMNDAADSAPSYDTVVNSQPAAKEVQPPAYSDVFNYGTSTSFFAPPASNNNPQESNNTQATGPNTQGTYYDWSQSAFTYS